MIPGVLGSAIYALYMQQVVGSSTTQQKRIYGGKQLAWEMVSTLCMFHELQFGLLPEHPLEPGVHLLLYFRPPPSKKSGFAFQAPSQDMNQSQVSGEGLALSFTVYSRSKLKYWLKHINFCFAFEFGFCSVWKQTEGKQ